MPSYSKSLKPHALGPILCLLASACGHQARIDTPPREILAGGNYQDEAPPTAPNPTASAGSEAKPTKESTVATEGFPTLLDLVTPPDGLSWPEEPATGSSEAVHPVRTAQESTEASESFPTPLDLATPPDDLSSPEEPATDSSEAVHPVWQVRHGEDLYTALVRWCTRTERWEAKRDTHYRWPIDADAVFQAPFLEAVSRLQEALDNRDPRPALTAYHGNHQIVIRDNSTEQY